MFLCRKVAHFMPDCQVFFTNKKTSLPLRLNNCVKYFWHILLRICGTLWSGSVAHFRPDLWHCLVRIIQFYGFKLHLVVNDNGEIISFVITQGNVDDRDPLMNSNLLAQVQGKLFGDRGYLSQKLFEMLFVDGIHLITKIRSNMKNSLMSLEDKVLLRKRALIESINDELKNICQIEHSRHRSFSNFVVNLISSLVAYSFFPKKPAIQFEAVNSQQLTLF